MKTSAGHFWVRLDFAPAKTNGLTGPSPQSRLSLSALLLSATSRVSPSTLLLLAVTYHTPPNLTSLTTLQPHTHTLLTTSPHPPHIRKHPIFLFIFPCNYHPQPVFHLLPPLCLLKQAPSLFVPVLFPSRICCLGLFPRTLNSGIAQGSFCY